MALVVRRVVLSFMLGMVDEIDVLLDENCSWSPLALGSSIAPKL